MPKKYRDQNMVSHYESSGKVVPISKFDRIQQKGGRVFGGKVAVDVAKMPKKWQRSGILKKYGEQFSDPQHQDMLRIDTGSPPKTIDPRATEYEDIFHSPLLVRVD